MLGFTNCAGCGSRIWRGFGKLCDSCQFAVDGRTSQKREDFFFGLKMAGYLAAAAVLLLFKGWTPWLAYGLLLAAVVFILRYMCGFRW